MCQHDPVRHVQLTIADLSIGSRRLPLLHGTLVVVERPEDNTLDWEVVVQTIEQEPIAHAEHDLTLNVITLVDIDRGLQLTEHNGRAIVVRSPDRTIVFRGDGHLDGFDPALLDSPP